MEFKQSKRHLWIATIALVLGAVSFVILTLGFGMIVNGQCGFSFRMPTSFACGSFVFLVILIPLFFVWWGFFSLWRAETGAISNIIRMLLYILLFASAAQGVNLIFFGAHIDTAPHFRPVLPYITDPIINKMEASGELLSLSSDNIEVQPNIESYFYLGFRNVDSVDRCYKVLIKCVNAVNGGKCPSSPTEQNNVKAGGYYPTNYSDIVQGSSLNWFRVFSDVKIRSNDSAVFPSFAKVEPNVKGDYLMETVIWQSTNSPGDCSEGEYSTEPYQTKEFYLKATQKP